MSDVSPDSAALSAFPERPRPPAEPAAGPSRRDLLEQLRSGDAGQLRRVLTQLVEATEAGGPAADADGELEKLLAGLLRHPEPRLRLHAHRSARKLLDRATFLRHTTVLLDDPRPEVVRSAIGTLCHGGYQPAIPAIVGLLRHAHATVRRAASDGLVQFGSTAIPALRHAADHARPDKRHLYAAVLDRITG